MKKKTVNRKLMYFPYFFSTIFGRAISSLVAQINKKMIDDVKVILAEYRLALKIYNTNRKK